MNVQVKSQGNDTLNNHYHSDLLKLYFVNGYGAIYQFGYSNNSFYRVHLDINTEGYDSNENRNSVTYNPTPTKDNYSEDINETSWEIQFAPEYCMSVISKGHFNLYAGIGPLFSYGYSNRVVKEEQSDFYSYGSTISKKYGLGIICLVGVESKITDYLNIFSEIDIKGGKSWLNYDSKSEQRFIPSDGSRHSTESSQQEWFYELSKIKIGISFLF
jgi:hypothetical protein